MSKISPEIQKAVDELVKVICQSEEFLEYKEAKSNAVKNVDDLLDIKRSQEIRNQLHQIPDNEKGSDWVENLLSEYEELMEKTVVYKYSQAEVAIGEICRDVFTSIIDTMEF